VAIDTVAELLAAIAALPPAEQAVARARVAAALEVPAPGVRAALGLLALDLAVVRIEGDVQGAGGDGPRVVLPELDRLGA
jgi:hypothetical protein